MEKMKELTDEQLKKVSGGNGEDYEACVSEHCSGLSGNQLKICAIQHHCFSLSPEIREKD